VRPAVGLNRILDRLDVEDGGEDAHTKKRFEDLGTKPIAGLLTARRSGRGDNR
jgi:hypothetical protein